MKRDEVARAVVVARIREFFHVSASPRVATGVFALLTLIVSAYPIAAHSPGATDAGPALPSPLEPAVPLQEATTDGGMPAVASIVLGRLPKPGPNQKRTGQCDPERSQVEMSGGCWVKTEHPLPCPEGKQWEHEGRCWLPVAHAAQTPTSGDVYPVNLANP